MLFQVTNNILHFPDMLSDQPKTVSMQECEYDMVRVCQNISKIQSSMMKKGRLGVVTMSCE